MRGPCSFPARRASSNRDDRLGWRTSPPPPPPSAASTPRTWPANRCSTPRDARPLLPFFVEFTAVGTVNSTKNGSVGRSSGAPGFGGEAHGGGGLRGDDEQPGAG